MKGWTALVLRPSSLAVTALIVTGGLTGASPAICPLPSFSVLRPSSSILRPSSPVLRPLSPVPRGAQSREDLDAAIDRLGVFDDDERSAAAAAVRRAPGTVTLPALIDAAAGHADGFVRYRALVLLSGYDDPRVPDQFEQAIGDVNDQLRTVAYAYFERHPEPRLIPVFLKALDTEVGEFARPALTRALAAQGRDPKVQRVLVAELARGPETSRASLLEALGDYGITIAVAPVSKVVEGAGPFREEAALALGKIGDSKSVPLLEAVQRAAGPEMQPAVAAALCLLGTECVANRALLVRTLAEADRTPGLPDRLRTSALGLSAMAASGDVEAGRALLEVGVTATDPTRAPVAQAVAHLALTRPMALVALVDERQDRDTAMQLLREGLNAIDDDFRKEQLFVTLRTAYHAEGEGSARRPLLQSVINLLEY